MRMLWWGEIPIAKNQYVEITKSKKVPHISKHFLRKEDYKLLKAKLVSEQKQVLAKISTWHELLFLLFNKL